MSGASTSVPVRATVRTPDGVELAVFDFGGHGPDLILAHATGLHAMVWAPVVAHLTDSFRCVAFDERGHGDSGPSPGGYAWSGFAVDVTSVVDGLGLENPYGAGHSCGGAALLLAAADRPDRFAGLWCYEPVVRPGPRPGYEPGHPLAVGARRRRARFADRAEARRNYAAKPPFSRVAPAALDAYVAHGLADEPDGTVRLKCDPDTEAEVYANSGGHDAYERLPEVGIPVVLAHGTVSEGPLSPTVISQLAGRLPDARVEPAEGLGHFGPLEDPAAAAAGIATLCRRPGVP